MTLLENIFGEKIYKIFHKSFTDFLKLSLLHKLFLLMLILIFFYLVNRKSSVYEHYEDMTSGKRFESKFDEDVYDAFYSKYYDKMFSKHIIMTEKYNKKFSIFRKAWKEGKR